jgi:predicted aspartyl protease
MKYLPYTPLSSPVASSIPGKRTEVALVTDSGVLTVPALVNGMIPLHFVLDSGASDVSIPADVVLILMRTGTLTESDFIGTAKYRMADGSVVPSTTFRLRSIKVGDRVEENVVASMTGVEGALLLGQSFLGRFQRWSINNARQALELE